MGSVDHFFALSNPALVSALSKKSFSSVSCPISTAKTIVLKYKYVSCIQAMLKRCGLRQELGACVRCTFVQYKYLSGSGKLVLSAKYFVMYH
jgi:hypothetical protein